MAGHACLWPRHPGDTPLGSSPALDVWSVSCGQERPCHGPSGSSGSQDLGAPQRPSLLQAGVLASEVPRAPPFQAAGPAALIGSPGPQVTDSGAAFSLERGRTTICWVPVVCQVLPAPPFIGCLLYASCFLPLGPLISPQPCEVAVSTCPPGPRGQEGPPEQGFKPRSLSPKTTYTLAATCSVLEGGAEVGEGPQLPGNRSLAHRPRPVPTWPSSGGGGVGGLPE